MTRLVIFSAIFCFFLTDALSQSSTLIDNTTDIFRKIEDQSGGKIKFSQNDSINKLIRKHIAHNENKDGIRGYRIRIYSNLGTGAREESQEIRTEFYEKFPDIPIYREYDSPYFKIYVGDFRTKIEAIKSLKKIQKHFPSAFVVPDTINYPELK
ncbi:MAG: SPOR domain-containing protein [Bacteroidota bacterium]